MLFILNKSPQYCPGLLSDAQQLSSLVPTLSAPVAKRQTQEQEQGLGAYVCTGGPYSQTVLMEVLLEGEPRRVVTNIDYTYTPTTLPTPK